MAIYLVTETAYVKDVTTYQTMHPGRTKTAFLSTKIDFFFWVSAVCPSQTSPLVEKGTPLPTTYHPRRLRCLDLGSRGNCHGSYGVLATPLTASDFIKFVYASQAAAVPRALVAE